VADYSRDLDQVKNDIKSPRHLTQHKASKAAEDLPGLGLFYCIECAKYFSDSHNLNEHRKGKNHKRRVRMLKEEAHSQKLAEAAVGLGIDNGQKVDAMDGS
jgi:bud site selection protein 20